MSECQPHRWKHACFGMFGSGLIPMGYAHHFSLVCGRLLVHIDSYVLVVIMYSDVRDDTTMDNNAF